MNPKDFKSKVAGKCVRTLGGHWAFVPAALPHRVELDVIWPELSEADAALGAVRGLAAGAQLPFVRHPRKRPMTRSVRTGSANVTVITNLTKLQEAELSLVMVPRVKK